MFDDEVAVEQNRFDLSEEGIVAIEVGPARLRHADFWILEIRDRTAKKIRFGNEVGIKDSNKFTESRFQSIFKSACFETFAVAAMNMADGNALRGVAFDASLCDLAGFVGGIVQDLNIEKFRRVIEPRDGFDQTFGDVAFIENRKLHGDARPVRD